MEYAIFRAEDKVHEAWVNQFPTLEEDKVIADYYYAYTGFEHVVVPVDERDVAEDERVNWDALDVVYSTYDHEEEE